MQKKKQLIVIQGPTASGKTSLSVELAKRWGTVILSADSRQFYKEIAIGTAKPSKEEQEEIKHYFIDSHQLEEELTAAQFAKEALKVLEQEFKTHDKIILVGGSGLFIDALCYGLDNIPTSPELKIQLTDFVNQGGLNELLIELKDKDPEYFDTVDKSNPMRIIRAIEAIRLTNQPYSKLRTNAAIQHFFEIKPFVLQHEREILYDRINQRVDLMIEAGLLEEVKTVQHLQHLKSLKTVGYTEVFAFLNNEINWERAVELIKQNTRRYAKRQTTWFKRNLKNNWLPYTSTKNLADQIEQFIM